MTRQLLEEVVAAALPWNAERQLRYADASNLSFFLVVSAVGFTAMYAAVTVLSLFAVFLFADWNIASDLKMIVIWPWSGWKLDRTETLIDPVLQMIVVWSGLLGAGWFALHRWKELRGLGSKTLVAWSLGHIWVPLLLSGWTAIQCAEVIAFHRAQYAATAWTPGTVENFYRGRAIVLIAMIAVWFGWRMKVVEAKQFDNPSALADSATVVFLSGLCAFFLVLALHFGNLRGFG